MKTTAIFLILLSFISYAYTQKAFIHVRNLLTQFRQTNTDEQVSADIREKKERAWCTLNIGIATKELNMRIQSGASLKKQITALELQISEWTHEITTRRQRISQNNLMIKKFKKQRCDNNLIFIQNLRDHIEAIDILSLLRRDIVEYFSKKIQMKGKSFAQIDAHLEVQLFERISNLAHYAHILSHDKKEVLTQLTKFGDDVRAHTKNVDAFSRTQSRSSKQIGSGHVDNTRGALKRLETPTFQGKLEFNIQTRTKILKMIDGLIAHLKASKNRLTEDEIRAAIDFANFQLSIKRENKHLEETIQEYTFKVREGRVRLNRLKSSYRKIAKLIKQARVKVESLQKLCNSKYDYFRRETKRRTQENYLIQKATDIFIKLMARSAKYRNTDERVVAAEGGINKGLAGRIKERSAVAL